MLEEDKVIWTKSNNGKFSNKALYWALEPRSLVSFLTGVFWNSYVRTKVGFSIWETTWKNV